ncbi:MAG TPA: cytochrome c maturation protein CcmE [Polyangia bacterium]|jgi:cytochrome c-type biogenesis protein CcmE
MLDRLNLRVGIVGLLAGGAIGLWGALNPPREPYYYRFVDEVVAGLQKFREQRALLDVHGCVVHESIERRTGTGEYRFRLAIRRDRPPAAITVRYAGWVPDTFRSDAEIIVKGRLGCDNALEVVPDGIMAKCPSKYAADPPPPDADIPPRDDWTCTEP